MPGWSYVIDLILGKKKREEEPNVRTCKCGHPVLIQDDGVWCLTCQGEFKEEE